MARYMLHAVLAAALLWSISIMAPAHARTLSPIGFDVLEGWHAEAVADAFAAFHRSCREIVESGRGFNGGPRYGGSRDDWLSTCRAALSQPEAISDAVARDFFQGHFAPLAVSDRERPQGLFTGYFEPEVEGSKRRGGPYQVPLYRKPDDLVTFDAEVETRLGVRYGRMAGGNPQPYFTRQEIEESALAGRGLEFLWLKRWEDAFFLHIQGSGRVRLEDGSTVRVGFAAKSGQPYTPIGRILVERGEVAREEISMQTILAWLRANPGEARQLMWENRSFVFFREIVLGRPDLGPPGAQGVQLMPERSLAVDRSLFAFGTPIWLDTAVPAGPDGSLLPMRQLMVAQDTGTAIKGHLRGDVFWGVGERAAEIAGRMQSPGRMIILLPKALALRLAQ